MRARRGVALGAWILTAGCLDAPAQARVRVHIAGLTALALGALRVDDLAVYAEPADVDSGITQRRVIAKPVHVGDVFEFWIRLPARTYRRVYADVLAYQGQAGIAM